MTCYVGAAADLLQYIQTLPNIFKDNKWLFFESVFKVCVAGPERAKTILLSPFDHVHYGRGTNHVCVMRWKKFVETRFGF